LTPSVSEANIDAANCAVYVDGKALAAPTPDFIMAALGLRPDPPRVEGRPTWWETDDVVGRDRHFRIAFTEAITLGTMVTTYTGPTSRPLQPLSGQWVSYLKPDAAYPGDVTQDEQWVTLPAGMVKTLPPGG